MTPFARMVGLTWVVVLIATSGTILLAAVDARAPSSPGALGSTLVPMLSTIFERIAALLWQALDRQPSIALAGAVAMAVPVVSASAGLWRVIRQQTSRVTIGEHTDLPLPVAAAWIVDAKNELPPVRIGEIAHIGSDEDCDVAISVSSNPGMRAVIERTTDCEFFVLALGEAEEHAVKVNGTTSRRCRLNDGDRIEIGGTSFVFRLGGSTAAAPLACR